MTTLADLQLGDQFIFACQVASVDVTGMALKLFGPSNVQAAEAIIDATGAMTGHLADTPDNIPIQLVTGQVPIAIGDVMENVQTGETLVCRWIQLNRDGTSRWSSYADHTVIYNAEGWTNLGHFRPGSVNPPNTGLGDAQLKKPAVDGSE